MQRNGELLMLNLGCGTRTHPAWVNIDHSLKMALTSIRFVQYFIGVTIPAGYINHDLRKGIPFPDGAADVVYSSHVLEHLERGYALSFLQEMRRVLKRGGIIRLVVPDLEIAVSAYLDALRTIREDIAGLPENWERFEWSSIALLDQMVRTQPGGELATWLREHRDSKFVQSMAGIFLEIADSNAPFVPQKGLAARIAGFLRPKDPAKTGELHRWMYDEVSLGQLFVKAGFKDVRRMSHLESRVHQWSAYHLDSNPDGMPHQPGSIWMEAVK